MSTDALSLPAGGGFLTAPSPRSFAPEDFSADDRLMIEAADDFSRNEVVPLAERLDAQEPGLMPGLIRKAGELGLCGVDSPEAFGGLGLSKNLAARILEFMSRNASFSVTYGITSGISQVGLSLFGTEAQKAAFLPKLAAGEHIGAYCLSEPNSGSDALSATTRADRRGGSYVLNGTKMWISNAQWADVFLVMAKADGERFSAFLVERDRAGLSISREEHKMGLKGSSTARVLLEDVEIPADHLLHEEGKGHQVAFNALNLGRFKLASMSLGPAREAMGLAARYALDRRQFGRPIAEFDLIRHKFAMMAALFYVAESMVYRTGAMIDAAFDAWGGSVDGNRKAAEEYAVECSACKVFATEVEGWIVDEALQVYGGYGFTEEFPIARIYRDARVSRIYEGTNEINRIFMADRLRRKVGPDAWPAPGSEGFQGLPYLQQLACAALSEGAGDQVQQAAASDLVMLAYAEQSARLRSERFGGIQAEAYRLARPWLEARAAEAAQRISEGPTVLGHAPKADYRAISDQVLASFGPL